MLLMAIFEEKKTNRRIMCVLCALLMFVIAYKMFSGRYPLF